MKPYYILELLITNPNGTTMGVLEQYYDRFDSACLAAAAHHHYKPRLWEVTVTHANGRAQEQRQRLMPEMLI